MSSGVPAGSYHSPPVAHLLFSFTMTDARDLVLTKDFPAGRVALAISKAMAAHFQWVKLLLRVQQAHKQIMQISNTGAL